MTRAIEGGSPAADPLQEEQALVRLKSKLFSRSAASPSVGRYTLEERLGAGGVGVVHAAHDPELDRRVAVKLLRPGSAEDASEGQARLLREARALAKLSHPNIVPVFDVGTHDDGKARGVYIVMELVDGLDLAKWLVNPVSFQRRLEVFRDAGKGLAAAHAAGIVHRDFKPANVIVGSDGRVRVLDFGLAVASPTAERHPSTSAQGSSLLTSPLTQTGGVLGTPAYMAPEQHDGRGADAKSDQYAFCISLWEALAGSRPFPQKTMKALAAAKNDGPPKTELEGVPGPVARAIRIGLAPDPNDRHPDMWPLISALAPRGSRRTGVVVASILCAGALVGAGLWIATVRDLESLPSCDDHERLLRSVWSSSHKSKIRAAFLATGRPYANATYDAVVDEFDTYTESWSAFRKSRCESSSSDDAQSLETLNQANLCADRHLARLGELVTLFEDADAELVDRAILAADRLPPVAQCDALSGERLAPEQRQAFDALDDQLVRAAALQDAGRFEPALVIARKTVEDARSLGADGRRARAELLVGGLLDKLGRGDEAVVVLRDAANSADATPDAALGVRARLSLVGILGRHQNAFEAAHERLDQARATIESDALGDEERYALARAEGSLAAAEGKIEDAQAAFQRALALAEGLEGEHSLEVADTLNSLAAALQSSGRPGPLREATRHYERALDIFEGELGPGHPHVAMVINNLGNVAQLDGEIEKAAEYQQRALTLTKATFGSEHPRTADSYNNLANALGELGRHEEALAHHERALDIRIKRYGRRHVMVAVSLLNLSGIHHALDHAEQAIETARESVAVLEASVEPGHPHFGYAYTALGSALALRETAEDDAKAREALDEAIATWEASVGPDSLLLAEPLAELAKLDLRRDAAQRAHVSPKRAKARTKPRANTEDFLADP